YYRLQYNPLNAANVSIKQVDVGYQRDAVLPLVSTLQASADAVLLKIDSFGSDGAVTDADISQVQSNEIFALLLAAELITSDGIVVHQVDTVFAYLDLGDAYEAKRSWIKSVLNNYLALQTNVVQEKLSNFFGSPVDKVNHFRKLLPYSMPSVLEFTGDPDYYVSIEDSAPFTLSDQFTIDLWINVNHFYKMNQTIISQGSNWWLFQNNEQDDSLNFGLNTVDGLKTVITRFFNDDQHWHHVAVTFDGTQLTLFIDGIGTSKKINDQPEQSSEEKIHLGVNLSTDDSDTSFKGQMARVRIWDSVKSIDQLMYDDTHQADDLQACWLLTSGYGRIIYNAAGEKYNGIVSHETPHWHNYYFNHLLADSEKEKTSKLDVELLFAQLAKHNNVMQWLTLDAEIIQALLDTPESFGLPGMAYNFNYTPALVRALDSYRVFSTEFKDNNNKLLTYFAMTSPDEDVEQSNKIQLLAFITGWNETEIYTLEMGLESYDFNTMAGIAVLRQCFHITQRLNIQAQQLIDLSDLNDKNATGNWPSYNQISTNILQASTALATNGNKTDVDVIRQKSVQENERNLLTGHLLAQINQVFEDIKTPDDLYAFLLVDVKMSGSTMISPMILGINSLQLYIQRSQLSLEAGVIGNIPERQWQWMQSYSTWRANRQVYLYPENYIDPSLRRLQTPLYKTLQNELLQGDVDKATINSAFGRYVDGLANIANMKIVDAYYCQLEKDLNNRNFVALGGQSIFLFAKSPSESGTFYHRTLTLFDRETDSDKSPPPYHYLPWKKIDFTINADTLSGIYAFNKLYVFWVEQQDKQLNGDDGKNYTITTADIKFSFQSADQQWSSPQTLQKDIVIFASGQKDMYDNNKTNLLGFSYDNTGQYRYSSEWQKVRLMVTTLADQPSLIVEYGSVISSDHTLEPDENTSDTSGLADVQVFNNMLYSAATNAYELSDSYQQHLTAMIPVLSLNQDLVVKRYYLDYSPGNFKTYQIAYRLIGTPEKTLACSIPVYYQLTGYWSFNSIWSDMVPDNNNLAVASDNNSKLIISKDNPLGYGAVLFCEKSYVTLENTDDNSFSLLNSSNDVMNIDFWFNQQQYSDKDETYILAKEGEWYLKISEGSKSDRRDLVFRFYYGSSKQYLDVSVKSSSDKPYSDNSWHHVQISVFKGDTMIEIKFSLDGDEHIGHQSFDKLTGSDTHNILLGAYNSSTSTKFNGYLSGFSIFLCQSQPTNIKTNINKILPPYFVSESGVTLCESSYESMPSVFSINNRPNCVYYSTSDDIFLVT
ncbi:MAG: hypothetical protein JKY13_03745, partial [Gammaproteobacteria bacterium]|nr:hypothetical protein [Gammaproteobacteria bacterium]